MLAKGRASALPLTGLAINRFEKERKRDGFVAERLSASLNPRAAVMAMRPDGVSVLVRDGTNWLHPIYSAEADSAPLVTIDAASALYIGEKTASQENIFVADAACVSAALTQRGTWASPRHLMGVLDAAESPAENALLSLCVSMYQWLQFTRFCTRCGAAVVPVNGGLSVACTNCTARMHPQVTPAVIVAVLDGNGHVLLCQRRRSGRVSDDGRPMRTVLSGFVSQGESMEETVVREVEEESQAKVTSLRCVGSQPWPFPHELMCAYYAVAPCSRKLVAEEDELFSVAWVSKEDLRRAMAGEHPDYTIPPPFTAAHFLLDAWANGKVDDNGLPVS